jgi:hypothetical protein
MHSRWKVKPLNVLSVSLLFSFSGARAQSVAGVSATWVDDASNTVNTYSAELDYTASLYYGTYTEVIYSITSARSEQEVPRATH